MVVQTAILQEFTHCINDKSIKSNLFYRVRLEVFLIWPYNILPRKGDLRYWLKLLT